VAENIRSRVAPPLIDNAIDAVADDPRTVGRHPRGTVTVRISGRADMPTCG